MSSQNINTVFAKNQFNSLLTQTNKSKKPIVIEKRGEPVAVLLDYETYMASQPRQKDKGSLMQELKAWHQHLRKKYPEGMGDSVETLRSIRAQRNS